MLIPGKKGRGWALWKCLITFEVFRNKDSKIALEMKRIINVIIDDFKESAVKQLL
jgi:hypothetical protein